MKEQVSLINSGMEESYQAKRILSLLIWVSWAAYLVVILSSLYWDDWKVISVTLITSVILAIPFWLLKRGHFLISGFLLVMIVLGNITFLATIGQGIHDLAILAYPVIIIFASLALNRLGFRISVLLTLASMGWLVFGEASGAFISNSYEIPGLVDFLVITAVLMAAALAVDLLANNMRKNLERARQEITQRKQVEAVLREKEVQYQNLADSGIALIWTSGTDKLCNYFNIPWLRFTGRTLEQEMGNGWVEGVHPEDFSRCLETYMMAFDKRNAFSMEYRLRHVSGEYRWIQDMGTPNYNSSGEFVGYIGHCFDITEHKHLEEQLRYQSSHDVMTGIYNRNFFEEELARLERSREYPISIIIADVDGLKLVNDTIGHAAGDELIRQAADVLRSVFRAGDILARIGGDEFAVLLPTTDAPTAERIISRVRERLAERNAAGDVLSVHLSIGSATAAHGDLAGTFTIADQRMYAEKAVRRSSANQVSTQPTTH